MNNSKIKHNPLFNTKKCEELYSKKDGVPVKYVCTSAFNSAEDAWAGDIFYRETPHPEFGNRYFALYHSVFDDGIRIASADNIENLTFNLLHVKDHYIYSSHRHDMVGEDGLMIDGGRAYLRTSGDAKSVSCLIKDGEFQEKEDAQ